MHLLDADRSRSKPPPCPVCQRESRLLKQEFRTDEAYRVHRCSGCKSIFCKDHYAPISPVYVSRTADDIDSFVLWCQGEGKVHAYRQLFGLLRALRHPIDSILDFGCGTGGFLRYAREQGAHALYGFDASAGQVAVAQRDLPEVRHSTAFSDYRSGHRRIQKLDLITLWDVIEHLRDPVRAFADIRAGCSPHTLVYISTPNGSSEYLKLHMRRLLGIPHSFVPWEHVLYFSRCGLHLFLESNGFEVVRSVATACYRRPLAPVEIIRRAGFAAASSTKYAPQLAVLCRLRTDVSEPPSKRIREFSDGDSSQEGIRPVAGRSGICREPHNATIPQRQFV